MLVVGVDGCPGGWLAMAYDTESGSLQPYVHPTLRDVLDAYPGAAGVAIDIPIGLIKGKPQRRCDVEARKVLRFPRSTSVFRAPDPRCVHATSYEEARECSLLMTERSMPIQTYGILHKVAEANDLLTPALQATVIEIHPELSFWALAQSRSMIHNKGSADGFDERHVLLVSEFADLPVQSRDEAGRLVRHAAADDVLDAMAAAWTARRYAEGRSGRLPTVPETDANGLRVEMVY